MQAVQKLLATRGGTVALGGLAALLSAAIFLVYLKRYRESVAEASRPMTVLVAKSAIEKGTPGDIVGTEELFQSTTVPKDELKEGAITDPASLQNHVATDDIYAGQQLTVADFKPAPANAIGGKLTRHERAISVPLDSAHGMIGHVRAGDYVDVLGGFNVQSDAAARPVPILKPIVQDVLVLHAPTADTKGGLGAGAGSTTTSVTLRMTDEQAANVAFAADNGNVWVVLRPKTGAKQAEPSLVTLDTLLFGVEPIKILRSYRPARAGGGRP